MNCLFETMKSTDIWFIGMETLSAGDRFMGSDRP